MTPPSDQEPPARPGPPTAARPRDRRPDLLPAAPPGIRATGADGAVAGEAEAAGEVATPEEVARPRRPPGRRLAGRGTRRPGPVRDRRVAEEIETGEPGADRAVPRPGPDVHRADPVDVKVRGHSGGAVVPGGAPQNVPRPSRHRPRWCGPTVPPNGPRRQQPPPIAAERCWCASFRVGSWASSSGSRWPPSALR